ncbi:MAG TPA: hypothetical protein VKI44_13505 [Acetobacteraceae bacterium]|nr:hypothetical protein [Acetobacteraceae bacterium]
MISLILHFLFACFVICLAVAVVVWLVASLPTFLWIMAKVIAITACIYGGFALTIALIGLAFWLDPTGTWLVVVLLAIPLSALPLVLLHPEWFQTR